MLTKEAKLHSAADPIVGLVITVAILGIVWQSSRSVLTRMLDGVDPGVVDEIRHAADHVQGIEKVIDVKARWIGHKLQADVTIAIDDGLLLGAANNIADTLKRELFEHLPALATANVHFGKAHDGGHGHRAPDPFMVGGKLDGGRLEIVDTAAGERMRLRVSRHAEGLRASVGIEREGGRIETLDFSRSPAIITYWKA